MTETTYNQTSNESETKNLPSHRAYRVDGEGRKATWTNIGNMWSHEDGKGFTLVLHGLTEDIKVTLRERKTKED